MEFNAYIKNYSVKDGGCPIVEYIYNIEKQWEELFQKKIKISDYVQLLKIVRKNKNIDYSFTLIKEELETLFRRDLINKLFEVIQNTNFLTHQFRYKMGDNDEYKSFYKILALIQLFLIVNPYGDTENEPLIKDCIQRLETFFQKDIFSEEPFSDKDFMEISEEEPIKKDDSNNNFLVDTIINTYNNATQCNNITQEKEEDINNFLADNATQLDTQEEDNDDIYFNLQQNISLDDDDDNAIFINKILALDFIMKKITVRVIDHLDQKFDATRKLVDFINKLVSYKVTDYNGFYFFNYFFVFPLKKTNVKEVLKDLIQKKKFNIVNLYQTHELINIKESRNPKQKNESEYYSLLCHRIKEHFNEYMTIKRGFKVLKEEGNTNFESLNRIIMQLLSLLNIINKGAQGGKLKRTYKIKYKKRIIPFFDEFLYTCFTKNGRQALINTLENFTIDLDSISENKLSNLSKILDLQWKNITSQIGNEVYMDTHSKYMKKVARNPDKKQFFKVQKRKNIKTSSIDKIRKRTRNFVKSLQE